MIKVKRVLISVSDKKGLLSFAKGLRTLGIEILSTGGTARQLRDAGIAAQEVSAYTGFPEILDGRVKTLHPKIHAGLLALRNKPEHLDQLKKHGIGLIDMVVVNLYPFESVISKKHVSFDEAIENIDIGGPAMLRAAAKNFKNVAVLCNPGRYPEILKELDTNSGLLSDSVLYNLAVEAFHHTAAYDQRISEFLKSRRQTRDAKVLDSPILGEHPLPPEFHLKYSKMQDLRYGENPHQLGAFYRNSESEGGLVKMRKLHGKELSFNNLLDLHAALEAVKDFQDPTAVIIKHGNPTGVAVEKTIARAYRGAWQCDPLSAFGGIIGFNRVVDEAAARAVIKSGFMECVIAPGFERGALEILKQKKNLRILEMDFKQLPEEKFNFKQVAGGLLVQEKDRRDLKSEELKVVTKKKPTAKQTAAMLFGWRLIKHVKSNAVILVKENKTVGIGCGLTSRVDCVRLAIGKAGSKAKKSVLISDAFLPKTDNVRLAAKAGVAAIIQTGGSIADPDVIQAADKAGIAMVMTGVRHFKH